ncbi:MAG: CDP-diacylglycerol--glycerol-3-phosphate 3-phosphatidyltransferase [Myxococcota bacterium]|nr:CDP-diacylglycerol--glycerol-3-phosphate 3-phosphatidyltransferase [Myxococcota bacterium]
MARSEQIWNLPNALTMLRMAVVPLMLGMPLMLTERGSTVLAWLYILAATTDVIDGWLARRGQQVTEVGKLLDPLADKMLVATSLIMLVAVGRIESWATWMVVVIVGRELAVTGLRGIASAGGTVMAATWHGKVKTLCQNVAISALLFHYSTLGLPAHQIGLVLLGVATLLTLWSGYAYFAAFFRDLVRQPS